MKSIAMLRALTVLSAAGFFPAGPARAYDHSKFDQVLKRYVDERGLVDYNGIAEDPEFKSYMESLKSADPGNASRNAQLAFWLNAYNAVTIDKVIRVKPKKSVRETLVPGIWTSTKFFTTRAHTVAGNSESPDSIEHEILRKRFHDPRIHFAIICASSGCPPLPRFAYTEQNVQDKLEVETRKYINSQRGIRIDSKRNTLYLSKLFDWFAGDFESKSGSVTAFIEPYLDDAALAFLRGNPKIEYLSYDWSLNAQEPLE